MTVVEVTLVITGGSFSLSAIIVGINLLRVTCIERRIKKLDNQMRSEISSKRASERGIPQALIDGQIKKIEVKFNEQIVRLERDRRFILDKLPFIRK